MEEDVTKWKCLYSGCSAEFVCRDESSKAQFEAKTLLKQHSAEEHEGFIFYCNICKYGMHKADTLASHLWVEHEIPSMNSALPMHRCLYPDCSFRGTRISGMGYHVTRSHLGIISKPIECPKCDVSFKSFKSFVIHSHLEHKEIPQNIEEYDHFLTESRFDSLQCQTCGKSVKSQAMLIRHMQRIHPDPEMAKLCNECGISFKLEYDLKQHQKNIHDPKTLTCDLCPSPKSGTEKKLYNKSSLKTHKLDRHINKNKHKCPKCDFAKNCTSKLSIHFRIKHLNYLPYKCIKCNNRFTNITNVKMHIQQVHEKNMNRNLNKDFFKENKGLYVNLKDVDPDFPNDTMVHKIIADLRKEKKNTRL